MSNKFQAKIKWFFPISLAVVLVSAQVMAQEARNNRVSPDNCETIFGAIDLVSDRLKRLTDKDSVLIILAGSEGRNTNRFDRLRIERLNKYLVDFRDAKLERIAWGVGPPSKTRFSYMRFYLDGKLLIELTLSPRTMFCTGDGEPLPEKERRGTR